MGELEKLYREAVTDIMIWRLRIIIPIGAFLHFAFTGLDYRVYQPFTNYFFWIRIIDTLLVMWIFMATFNPKMRKHMLGMALACPTILCVGMSFMIWVTDGTYSRYYEGINSTIIGILFANAFFFRANVIACLIQIGLYCAAVFANSVPFNSTHFLTALCSMLSHAVLTLVITKFYSDQHRKSYFKNLELKISQEKLEKTNEELSRLYRQAEDQSRHDLLTGLYNNSTFHDLLQKEFALAKRHNTLLCVMFVDMDYFKEINDTFGHQWGDKVLKTVADIIMAECRASDFPARYGGDEMAILLPHTPESHGLQLAQRIAERMQAINMESIGGPSQITASIGVAGISDDDTNYQQLLIRSDEAVYKSKERGRGLVSGWDASCRQLEHESDRFLEKINGRKEVVAKSASRSLMTNRINENFIADMGRHLNMTIQEISDMQIAYILRDIGIAGVPDSVLSKQGKLSARDWNVIKSHTKIGRDLLKRASSQFETVADAIYYHHEKWNGEGYPQGLKEKDIPRVARAVAVMDAFTAMVSERPYHTPMTSEQALAQIESQKNIQFDPEIADTFVRLGRQYQSSILFVTSNLLAA